MSNQQTCETHINLHQVAVVSNNAVEFFCYSESANTYLQFDTYVTKQSTCDAVASYIEKSNADVVASSLRNFN